MLSERKFCDDLKVKFASPVGGIQLAGAPVTATKKRYSLCLFAVGDYKRLDTRFYFITNNFHTELKP